MFSKNLPQKLRVDLSKDKKLFLKHFSPQESSKGETFFGVRGRTFKCIKSFFSRGKSGRMKKKLVKCS